MFPSTVCPATCELCGSWLPQHESSCARNGVHPSQWSSDIITEEDLISPQTMNIPSSLLSTDNVREQEYGGSLL